MADGSAGHAGGLVLPPEVASRIAAGEVIERPASVVKELVENSLDAGARRVEITVEDGGRELIQVTDDGEGMSPGDARVCVERHATSKITSADDLFRVRTYGFRGEALPSIASVSEFELVTKRGEDAQAFRMLIRGGLREEEGPSAGPDGTTVRVSRLFQNVPVRLKFMKSSQTELSRILDFVQRLALARPEVAFTLRHASQENFAHPGGDHLTALVSVFGRQVARELIPVESNGVISLRAYLAPPTRTRPNRTQQFFFVNGRPIGSRAISHAVDEAYSGLLPHGRYPVLVVLIDLPPEMVDVNVHPRKAEVKFVREHDVHSLVFHSVRQALLAQGLVPRVTPAPPDVESPAVTGAFSFDPAPAAAASFLDHTSAPVSPGAAGIYAPAQSTQSAPLETAPESRHIADQRLDPERLRILGQVADTYIVVETPEGMAILDQHVAHERVLYERFLRRASENPVQMLAVPITLELSRREALIVRERLKEFRDTGFLLEEFGTDTVLVRGVPAGIRQDRLEPALRDMISEVVEMTVERKILAPREAVITTAACKAAVKAGDRMSEPEMRSLIQQLLQCENPYVCPHGRPIMIRLDRASLEKIFQR